MSYIRNDLKHEAPAPLDVLWYGYFSKDVASMSDFATVILPDFDDTIHWEGCRWQSRDSTTLPRAGQDCLLAFDNRNQPWIIAWWPN